eukprot:357977-Chlamydomonas_euryale.AAC.5
MALQYGARAMQQQTTQPTCSGANQQDSGAKGCHPLLPPFPPFHHFLPRPFPQHRFAGTT